MSDVNENVAENDADGKKNIDVSVVLPTFNESSNITSLIRRNQQALRDYSREIIVVDDDSPDLTWKIAEDLKQPDVKVIRRMEEKRLVTAIQRGIDEARGKHVVWMDADCSMPPELIPRMLHELQRYPVVVGSRYVKGGKDKRPLLRVASSRFINLVANIALNFKVLDYDSGFVAARRDVLQQIRLQTSSGYGEYCIEFLYKAGKKGHRIKEVPYSFIDRRAGESKTADSLYGLFKFGMLYLKGIIKLRLKS